jgi:ATP-binding cassette subfamily F protein 3
LAAKEREAEEQAAAYRRQQERIARIETDIRSVSQRAAKVEGETQHDFIRGRMKKVARLAVVREKKLERLLESEDRVEKPQRRWGVAAGLPPPPLSGSRVIEATGVMVRFGERTVLAGVDLFVGQGDRIAITGPNGGGKTTLLRTLCGELRPDAGSVIVGPSVVIGRFAQEQETLDLTKSALEQVRSIVAMSESDARTFLHRFLFGGDMALRPAAQLSYGERARLALALVVLKGANLLVLDEPLNHLDLPSQERFEEALRQYQGTLLMVLHDWAAIARLATRTLELRGGQLREVGLTSER